MAMSESLPASGEMSACKCATAYLASSERTDFKAALFFSSHLLSHFSVSCSMTPGLQTGALQNQLVPMLQVGCSSLYAGWKRAQMIFHAGLAPCVKLSTATIRDSRRFTSICTRCMQRGLCIWPALLTLQPSGPAASCYTCASA